MRDVSGADRLQMTEGPFRPGELQIVTEPPAAWARAHPEFFFESGIPSLEELERLLFGVASRLSCAEVGCTRHDGWFVVSTTDDWFANGSLPIEEDELLNQLRAYPEGGANSVRPEFLIAVFAREVVVRGSRGVRVVKGSAMPEEALLCSGEGEASWVRQVAFRGLA